MSESIEDPSGSPTVSEDPSDQATSSIRSSSVMEGSVAEQQSHSDIPRAVGVDEEVGQTKDFPQAKESSDREAEGNDCVISDAVSENSLFVDQEDEIKSEDRSEDGGDDRGDNKGGDNGEIDGHAQDLEFHEELGEDNKDDDSDECVEINANDVSDAARAKFAEFEFGGYPEAAGDVICMGSVQIKAEEQHDAGFRTSPEASDDDKDSDFEMDGDGPLSDGEDRRKRRRWGSNRQNKRNTNSTRAKPAQRHPGSVPQKRWEMPTDEELIELYTQQEELSALRAEGSLTCSQKVVLAKTTARIAIIERRATQKAPELGLPMESLGEGHEDSEAPALAAVQLGLPAHEQAASTGLNQNQSTNPTSKTPRRPAPKTAKEYWERQYAEKGSGIRNITENLGKRKRATKKPTRGKNGREDDKEGRVVRMLQGSNPIVARAAQGSMPMPGPIQATRQSDQVNAMKDFFFKITGNANPGSKSDDERRLAEAIRSFGYKQVRAANGKWELKGMRSTLYNHQLVGVSWMLRQEFSPEGPYGGILADQMGLGKTVQILAAMSANRPSKEDIVAGRHQTLIAAPAAAVGQWGREINKHCSFVNAVHRYRAKSNLEPEMLRQADVILVSYNEISNAFPSNKVLKEIAGKELNEKEWMEEYDKLLGELFKMDFFRVVLDEGHAIRNHETKTARACINLTSKYRWILTGTPLHNNIEELYAYFRFLGVHWADDLDQFSKQFGNIEEDDARGRLNAIITSLMLRRRVDDTFLGVPILEIPPPHPPKMIYVDLTTEERLIYRRLESRFRDNISTHLKAGIAEKKLNTYLAYLTRLRQAVAHPFLLEGVLEANFTLEDFHYLRQQLSESGGKTPMHHQVQRWMTMEYEERASREGGTVSFGKSRFGYTFDMNAELEKMEARKSMGEVNCRICYDVPVDPRITDCGHTFCEDCIAGALQVKACCPTCKTVLWQVDALNEPDEIVDEQSEDEGAGKKTRRKKKKSEEDREVGDDENLVQPKMKDSSKWVKEYDKNFPNKDLCASAKTIAVKNQILIWQEEAPEDKIIVFVNWTKLGCIIGRVLYEEGIRFLYYFGDLTRGQKDAAIAKFQTDPGIKVLVASIRCGGQALNLTFANRVISVDQWWNTAMENQAFGRVHRIGQEKTTYFVKIVVKDSIDEGLLQMQQEKDQMIAKALQEGVPRKAALTLEDLLRLFGVEEDVAGTGGDEAAHGEGEEEREREVVVLDDGENGEGNKARGDEVTEAGDGVEGGEM